MSASAGTAFVDIRGDFDPLTRELRAKFAEIGRQAATVHVNANTSKIDEVTAKLRAIGATDVTVRLDIRERAVRQEIAEVQGLLTALGAEKATPEINIATARAVEQLDRLEAKLAKIDHERTNVKVDVDVHGAERAVAALDDALSSLGRVAGNAIGGIQAIGGAITSLGPFVTGTAIIIGVLLAPALLLLGASLANAVFGAGALAAALAGLAGPVVLVAIAALARFAAILQALKERQTQSVKQGAVAAGAQDQIRGATDALAAAQANLKTATADAYRAWADSIEAVKDDLRDVQHAQLGIEAANLRLRDAQQALRAFRRETGTSGNALDTLFKRFADVDVKTSLSDISRGLGGAGAGLDNSQTLRLQHLLLDIKEAKLGEKDANDSLHDSNVKLRRDRQTEADFVKRGIAAYAPYRAAIQGVASAQQSLASAQRQSNTALVAQGKLWDQLTPAEQRFARRLQGFEDAFKRAFGPSVSRILGGFGNALDKIGEALNKKGVRDSLTRLGAAIGLTFQSIANTLTSKEFLGAFETFTNTAARLIRTLGATAARDFLRLFLRVATQALPTLVRGIDGLLKKFDTWLGKVTQAETRTRGFGSADTLPTSSPLQRFIDHAIDSFKTWIDTIKQLGRILGGFFKAMLPDGDKLAGSFHDIVKHFADWVNSRKGQDAIRNFFHAIRVDVEKTAQKLGEIAKVIPALTKGPLLQLPKVLRQDTPLGAIGHALGIPGFATGGLIGGTGRGDHIPALLEPGEFVIRRPAVDAVGLAALNAINTTGDAGSGNTHNGDINLSVSHHHDDVILGVRIRRELEQIVSGRTVTSTMRRRGQGSLP